MTRYRPVTGSISFGDLCLKSVDGARRLLERLNGRKYLVAGNHDSCLRGLGNYFVRVGQIMTLTVRQGNYPFLGSDREIVMCHYPLADWPGRDRRHQSSRSLPRVI